MGLLAGSPGDFLGGLAAEGIPIDHTIANNERNQTYRRFAAVVKMGLGAGIRGAAVKLSAGSRVGGRFC